jgi:predicted ATP-dependent protease
MAAREIPAKKAGLPEFRIPKAKSGDKPVSAFDLSSHARARAALDFGLEADDPGFNIFVLGDDRAGRMTATRAHLERWASAREKAPSDWVYLNNFRRSHKPKPYRLPGGKGRRLRDMMKALVDDLHELIPSALKDPDHAEALRRQGMQFNTGLQQEVEDLRGEARKSGIDLRMTEQGPVATPLGPDGQPRKPEDMTAEDRTAFATAMGPIEARLAEINRQVIEQQNRFRESAIAAQRQIVAAAVAPRIEVIRSEFSALGGLGRWLTELQEDILDNIALFLRSEPPEDAPEGAVTGPVGASQRYAVNIVTDNADQKSMPVVVEPRPTYENLFGTMEYRIENGVLVTDFTMIRSGAIHRANGGILVIRADALAAMPGVWEYLKGAIRDGEIRIEEHHRSGAMPMTGAPKPKPVPLSVKVVLVGAPRWYYAFLSIDPEFSSYFKVKADIESDMPANATNIRVFAGIIRAQAARHGCGCTDEAVQLLLGLSSRWTSDRGKLAASFEVVEDIVAEAAHRAAAANGGKAVVDISHVREAVEGRRQRNSRVEDRTQEAIADNAVMIATDGAVVGQVNGLTVRQLGDHSFGAPARVTARTYIGEQGVINIDRLTGHGGPIQQKGMFILGGYLHGLFSRRRPVSFSATVTFEQSYGGVEGDSASLAELSAILSSLADLPVRQDLAITGSVNQLGQAQVIGGLHHKIEGFFRTCAERGLTGEQGVIFPRANERNLVLRDDVAEAVAAGRFHLWSVSTIEEAVELFTGAKCGKPSKAGRYPEDSLYGRVQRTLEAFDDELDGRAGA